MNRPAVLRTAALLVAVSGCAGPPTPAPVSPSAASLAPAPCDADVLTQALAAIDEVRGYRFTQEISWPSAPRRAGDERVWTSTRTHGAFLAPDRYREEVVSSDDPLGSSMGFVRAVSIGGSSWWLVPTVEGRAADWREVPPDRNGGNVLSVLTALVGDFEFAPVEADDLALLPGEGGCVMVADIDDPDEGAALAVRIDLAGPRIVAFLVDGEESRWRMEVSYELPTASEFVAPNLVQPTP